MDMNKLTEKAQEAIATAQRDAEQRHNTQLEPEHLLSALVKQTAGVVPAVLEKLGVSPGQVAQRLDSILANFARSQDQQGNRPQGLWLQTVGLKGAQAKRQRDRRQYLPQQQQRRQGRDGD